MSLKHGSGRVGSPRSLQIRDSFQSVPVSCDAGTTGDSSGLRPSERPSPQGGKGDQSLAGTVLTQGEAPYASDMKRIITWGITITTLLSGCRSQGTVQTDTSWDVETESEIRSTQGGGSSHTDHNDNSEG